MHSNALFHLCSETIKPQWIDYNGHMNVAYFLLVFDIGSDALFDYLGLDAEHRERSRTSAYVLEAHINFERELFQDAAVDIYLQLVDYDSKRIHYALFMQHRDEGYQAACCEFMAMYVDTRTARGAQMPDFAVQKLSELASAQADVPPPPNLGSIIGIRRKI